MGLNPLSWCQLLEIDCSLAPKIERIQKWGGGRVKHLKIDKLAHSIKEIKVRAWILSNSSYMAYLFLSYTKQAKVGYG